jgi:mRNA interferase MazF
MAGPSQLEIWQADFSGSRGHEQKKARPCIIWRDLGHLGMAVVIPLTGSVEKDIMPYTLYIEPTPENGLDKESVALVFQVTSIDKARLVKRLGFLNKEDIESVCALLKDLLRI